MTEVRWARGTSKTLLVEGSNVDPSTLTQKDFEVDRLDGAQYANPMLKIVDPQFKDEMVNGPTHKYIAFDPVIDMDSKTLISPLAIQLASIRGKLHFNPHTTNVGIVTCGGLCPGLNDVVRGITHACLSNYGVRSVKGFRYGFWGLSAAGRHTVLELTRSLVHDVHMHGGTFLGSSRGPQKADEMIETLLSLRINVLFCIGGDGTARGALMLGNACRARGLDLSVIAIPKTIDNDLSFSHRTFGFETAVEKAVDAIRAAHAESSSVRYGIGVVKIMGRYSGFIAAQAAIASELANLCFIPENPVDLKTVLECIETRFKFSTSCVIVVAEGFGQEWFKEKLGKDASGNQKLVDIGIFLSEAVKKWVKTQPRFAKTSQVKYIDPSYMVRGCPPNTSDAAFCVNLANLAVHEAMRGTTNAVLTYWYANYVVVPIKLATSMRRVVNTRGRMWKLVREITIGVMDEGELNRRRERLAKNELKAAEKTVMKWKNLIAKL